MGKEKLKMRRDDKLLWKSANVFQRVDEFSIITHCNGFEKISCWVCLAVFSSCGVLPIAAPAT